MEPTKPIPHKEVKRSDEFIVLPHLMFNFKYLIRFLCLRINLIRICDNWAYFSCIKYY